MKYICNRIMAYFIDMLIVVVIATLLSKVGFINPDLKNYTKYSKLYGELNLNYQNYVTDLQKYYSDGKFSEKEYEKITDEYGDISSSLTKYYDDNKITKKEYDKILNETNKSFMKQNKVLYYKLNKYSLAYNIIVTVCIILYFVLFNIYTNGQTLGKRLLGLRIVNIGGGKVSVVDYIIRCVILYGPIYYLLLIICPFMLKINDFYKLALVISNFKNYLMVIIFASIMFRQDNRGLHDILAHTKVSYVNDIKEEKLDVEYIKNDKKKNKKGKKVIIEDKGN